MKPNPASRRNAARLLLLAGLAAALPAAAQLFPLGQPELLEPEKAFRISARALDERTAEVQFRIARGYYMYRDRLSFATEAGEPLGEAEIPRGVVKEDPFFGKTETFRDLVRIRVPVSAQDMAKGSVNLKVTSQGCSDKGVCYVPLEQTVRVSLSPAEPVASTPTTNPMRVPWLLLAASLAGALVLAWASAGAPLPGKRKARLSSPARALWNLVLGAAGVFAGWPGSQRGEFDRPVRAAALQAVALAVLAAAAWAGSPLLPDVFRMLAWAAWLIAAAMLLRAIDPLPHNAPWLARLAKAAGVAMLVWGVAVAIGAMSGARDPFRPFEALTSDPATRRTVEPVRFERVTSLGQLESRIASAGRPVMLDFYADWCVSCKEMEQFTFSDPEVRARMQRMLLLQADVTRNSAEDKALLQRFRLFGPPGIIFFDAEGKELRQRVIGYQPPERFLRVLDAVLGERPV